MRHTYGEELSRLQTECTGIIAYRKNDQLFLDDLNAAARDVARAADREQNSGGQTGLRGKGTTTDYINGVAQWLSALENSALKIFEENKSQNSPYSERICTERVDGMRIMLSRNAFENYDLWVREFETEFEDFRLTLNSWRLDQRLQNFLEQQLANFDRANPVPFTQSGRLGELQRGVIESYSKEVTDALKSLLRKQKARKPPIPLPSEAEKSPERRLAIFTTWFKGDEENQAMYHKLKPGNQRALGEW